MMTSGTGNQSKRAFNALAVSTTLPKPGEATATIEEDPYGGQG